MKLFKVNRGLAVESDDDLRSWLNQGIILLIVLTAVVVGWGCTAEISSAVLASGKLSLESNVKKIQHKEGGIVSNLFVKEGDNVKAGQLLARLDATMAEANMILIAEELKALTARRMRLIAERDNLNAVPLPENKNLISEEMERAIRAEERLFDARKKMRIQQFDRLLQQISAQEAKIRASKLQLKVQEKKRILFEQEAEGLRSLFQKKLVSIIQVNSAERELAQIEGSKADLDASISSSRASIIEAKAQQLELQSTTMSEILTELKDTEMNLAKLMEKKANVEDMFRRIDLRAPVDGQLQELKVHTKGGVVSPGETLMLVVPDKDELIVEAMIDPKFIDQVRPGLTARIRFASFELATTPVFHADLDKISTDVIKDEASRKLYYLARLKIVASSIPNALADHLVSGMPAEVQITTGRRIAISYFLKPITDQLARTFKEE